MIRKMSNGIVTGVFAHVDAGKTTVTENILFNAGVISKPGRVDRGDSVLDSGTMEKERGITIFAGEAVFSWKNRLFFLIDTPGHSDFFGETERIFDVLDVAILLISGTEGVTGTTLKIWHQLKKRRVPVFIFVNKKDLDGFKENILEEIREKLSESAFYMSEGWLKDESLALSDDKALEEFFENGSITKKTAKRLINSCKAFPVLSGSALFNKGVKELMNALSDYTEEKNFGREFGAKVYRISRDENGTRLTHAKVTGGSITARSEIAEEKIKEIRVYSGKDYKLEETAKAGTICAFAGLSSTHAGQNLGAEKSERSISEERGMSLRIIPAHDGPDFRRASAELAEEFPDLMIREKKEQGILASPRGSVQKEAIKEIYKERYDLEVSFSEMILSYRETIKKPAEDIIFPAYPGGIPYLIMEVKPSSEEKVFVTADLRESQIAKEKAEELVEIFKDRIEDEEITGLLAGGRLTGIKVMIKSGRGRLKTLDTGDIQYSLENAFFRCIIKAGPILLEPFYSFVIALDSEHTGKASSLITSLTGTIIDQKQQNGFFMISGNIPASKAKSLSEQLQVLTKGGSEPVFQYAGFSPTPDRKKVQAAQAYLSENTGCYYEDVPEPEEPQSPSGEIHAGNAELKAIFEKTYGRKKEIKKEKKIIRGEESLWEYARHYKGGNKGLNSKVKPVIMVDGYNIIHAWEELRETAQIDIGAARDQLIEIMADYRGYTGEEIVVVFDAYKRKGPSAKIEEIYGVKVVYTAYEETADHYIEKTVHKEIKKHPITVATSDRLEQMNVFSAGARRLSARDLYAKVKAATFDK